jgi:hypothetical protein
MCLGFTILRAASPDPFEFQKLIRKCPVLQWGCNLGTEGGKIAREVIETWTFEEISATFHADQSQTKP